MQNATRETEAQTARLDEKGRLTIPSDIRRALDMKPGDVLYCVQVGTTVQCAKAINPFDVLAEYAIDEYRHGRTKTLRDFARERTEWPGGE